ncbi:MAG: CheR family methyltransferase [Deltaproteobacteria bacterium]
MIKLNDKEFKQVVDYINENYGINLSEKRILIEGRLQTALLDNGFESFSDYFDYIFKDKSGDCISNLINRLTTNHTFFMREKEHFDYLKNVVLPYLNSNLKERDLRIWSAGCSSGEEPYTIAMLVDEFLGSQKVLWDSKILATDISAKVLKTAADGIYDSEGLNAVSIQWRNNYFNKISANEYQVADKVKNEVIFRRFNLKNSEFPFKNRFHVIFCRNVLIYFDTQNKRELVKRFYDYTEHGGYLFIGHSESLTNDETGYKYIMPAIYRKE